MVFNGIVEERRANFGTRNWTANGPQAGGKLSLNLPYGGKTFRAVLLPKGPLAPAVKHRRFTACKQRARTAVKIRGRDLAKLESRSKARRKKREYEVEMAEPRIYMPRHVSEGLPLGPQRATGCGGGPMIKYYRGYTPASGGYPPLSGWDAAKRPESSQLLPASLSLLPS
ncbi:hypothetical protein KM043_012112 [Ampulex compressa]|nr:hypothetical protein KM043_012112 [Ampulex compressa]